MNLQYSQFSDQHFKTPRLMIQSAYPTEEQLLQGTGSGTDFWKYAIMYAPESISPIGWRLSELSKEQMERVRDSIQALYELHRTQFNDAVFAYVKGFRDSERVNASGSIDQRLTP